MCEYSKVRKKIVHWSNNKEKYLRKAKTPHIIMIKSGAGVGVAAWN